MKNKKIIFLSIIVIALAILFFIPSKANAASIITTCFPSDEDIIVGANGTYFTTSKETILSQINQYRKEACDNGYPDPRTDGSTNLTPSDYVPIKWSTDLETIARVRSAEASILEGHSRISKSSSPFYMTTNGVSSSSEVLAWFPSASSQTPLDGLTSWYFEKQDWLTYQNSNPNTIVGHYAEMIDPDNKYIGIGAFYVSGGNWSCIAGEFSTRTGLDESKNDFSGDCIQLLAINPAYVTAIQGYDFSLYKKFAAVPPVYVAASVGDKEFASLVYGGLELTSSDTNIVEISNNEVGGVGYGTTTVTATAGAYSTSFQVEIMAPPTVYKNVDYAPVYDFYYYVEKNPDVKAAFDSDPEKILEHFVIYGMKEGRQSSETFDVHSYKNAYVNLRNAFGTDLVKYYKHYINHGIKEGRTKTTGITSPIGGVTKLDGVDYSSVYDYKYYTSKYSDVVKAYGNDDIKILSHFVKHGMSEGRQAKDTFSVTSYAYKYADLRKAYKNDLAKYYIHYMKHGYAEGRVASGTTSIQKYATKYNGVNYSLVYDCNYYIKKYPDIKKAYGFDDEKILAHFVKHGMKEGRQANATFNVKVYKSKYKDLQKAYGTNLTKYFTHYIKHGYKEGRKAI